MDQGVRHRDAALDLLLNCLNYDFVGCATDDPTEDNTTIQVPPAWRPIFETTSNLTTVWEAYDLLLAHRPKILTILVQIASVRRSIFVTEEARTLFLQTMLAHSSATIRNGLFFEESESFHHMARLCARLVSVFNMQDLMLADRFIEWVGALVEFTVKGFRNWEVSSSFSRCVDAES